MDSCSIGVFSDRFLDVSFFARDAEVSGLGVVAGVELRRDSDPEEGFAILFNGTRCVVVEVEVAWASAASSSSR